MSNLSRRSFLRTGLAGGATLAVSTVSTAALAAKPAKPCNSLGMMILVALPSATLVMVSNAFSFTT